MDEQMQSQTTEFYINHVTSQNTNSPSDPQPNKKSKLPLILICSISGVVIIGIILFFIFFLQNKKDPNQVVKDAIFEALPTENVYSLLNEQLDVATLYKGMHDGFYQTGFDVTLDNLEGNALPEKIYLVKGLGLNGNLTIDIPEKRFAILSDISYGGISYADVSLYLEDDKAYVALPMLFDGYLTASTETLGEDYNQSLFAEQGEELVDPELSINVFDFYNDYLFSIFEPLEAAASTPDEFLPWITFTDGTSETILVGDAEVRCTAYPAVISRSFITSILSDYLTNITPLATRMGVNISMDYIEQFFSDEAPVELTAYLDNEDHLLRLSARAGLTYEGETYELTLEMNFANTSPEQKHLEGKIGIGLAGLAQTLKFTVDNEIAGTMITTNTSCKLSGNSFAMKCNCSYDTEDGSLILLSDLSSDNQTLANVSLSSILDVLEKGSEFSLDISSFQLDVPGTMKLALSGGITLNTTPAAFPIREGETRALFDMGFEEYLTFVVEVLNHLADNPLGSLIGSLLGF